MYSTKSIIGLMLIELALVLFVIGLYLDLLSLEYYPQAITLIFFYMVAVYHFKFQNQV